MAYEALNYLPTPDTTPLVGPGFVSQALLQNTAGMTHALNDGSTIGVEFKGSFWTINIAYPQLTESEAAPLINFFNKIRGPFKSFYVSLPTKTSPSAGDWTGNFNQLSVSATDDTILKIGNWSSQQNKGTISNQDSLKLSDGNKIYSVSEVSLDNNVLSVHLSSPIINQANISGGGVTLKSSENNDIKYKVRIEAVPVFTLTPEGVYNGFSISMRENIR